MGTFLPIKLAEENEERIKKFEFNYQPFNCDSLGIIDISSAKKKKTGYVIEISGYTALNRKTGKTVKYGYNDAIKKLENICGASFPETLTIETPDAKILYFYSDYTLEQIVDDLYVDGVPLWALQKHKNIKSKYKESLWPSLGKVDSDRFRIAGGINKEYEIIVSKLPNVFLALL